MNFFQRLFDTSDYPARWTCGNWSAFEGWLHIVSDLLIFCAYTAIPTALALLMLRRRAAAFPIIAWLFVAFILCCGFTHAIEASIFWWPAYRLSGLMKAITAVVSLATAVATIRALPEAIALPSVRRINADLTAALEREKALSEQITAAHATLEQRTSALAVRERRMREAVGSAKACAVRWDVETGEVLWELGFAEAMRSAGLDWHSEFKHWNLLLDAAAVESLLKKSRHHATEGTVIHTRYDLLGHEDTWDVRMTATPDAVIKGQPATMSGLLGLVPSVDSRA